MVAQKEKLLQKAALFKSDLCELNALLYFWNIFSVFKGYQTFRGKSQFNK